MGTDLTITLDHALPYAELASVEHWFTHRFHPMRRMPHDPLCVFEGFRWELPGNGTFSRQIRLGHVDFRSDDTSGVVAQTCLQINTGVRWRLFAERVELQAQWRKICELLADSLQTRLAVYHPCSGPLGELFLRSVRSGLSLDAIAAQAYAHCGPPVPTIEAILSDWENEHWYTESVQTRLLEE